MESKFIVSALLEEHQTYFYLVKEANALGREETARTLCDNWGQFMCDSSRDLLIKSRELENLGGKYPNCKKEVTEIARYLMKYSQIFSEKYTQFESLQREGVAPSNLPDLSSLLE